MSLNPVTYRIWYNQKNITKDISDYVKSISFSDKIAGESDELEISLQDKDLLWQGDWYPKKGDKIELEIDDSGLILKSGYMTIDENEYSSDRGSGDSFSIRALAAPISKNIRTKKNTAHENKSLKQIAQAIASSNGLTLIGQIDEIRIGRVTQFRETDLGFLDRISRQYGYTFSIRDSKLIFTDRLKLEDKSHILSIDKTGMISFSFKDKTQDTAKKAKVKYHNTSSNEVIDETVEYGDVSSDDSSPKEDELIVNIKAENKQQGERIAKSALSDRNSHEQTCSVTIPGNTLVITGVNLELTGIGRMSGIYHIIGSEHSIDRGSGYKTSFEAKKVKIIESAKHKPKEQKVGTVPRSVLVK